MNGNQLVFFFLSDDEGSESEDDDKDEDEVNSNSFVCLLYSL